LPQRIAHRVQLGHAPARPEVADHRVRFAADRARRTTLELSKTESGILDNRRLIRQTNRAIRCRTRARSCSLVIAIASPPPPTMSMGLLLFRCLSFELEVAIGIWSRTKTEIHFLSLGSVHKTSSVPALLTK